MCTTRTIAPHLPGSLYFWLHWESADAHRLSLVVASEGSSLAAVRRLLTASVSLGCRAWAREHKGFSGCGVWALLPWGTWNLPRARTSLMSPTLASGFLTTGPPGSPRNTNI